MSRTWFFILGSGRMGSTFLYRILREHPRVALANEERVLDALHLAWEAVTLPYGHESPRGFRGVIHESTLPRFAPIFLRHVREMVEEYYDQAYGRSCTHLGEKLPAVAAAVEAGRIWPDVRYVVLVRDPRDVVCSYRALQRVSDPTVLGPGWERLLAHTVTSLARQWRDTYREILDLVPDRLLVRYETLVTEPRPTIERILAHLGLDTHPKLLEALDRQPGPEGHGTSGTLAASIGRWRRELTAEEAATVASACGPVSAALGIPLRTGG